MLYINIMSLYTPGSKLREIPMRDQYIPMGSIQNYLRTSHVERPTYSHTQLVGNTAERCALKYVVTF